MLKIIIAVFMMVGIFVSNSEARFHKDAMGIKKYCENNSSFTKGYCLGYIAGVLDWKSLMFIYKDTTKENKLIECSGKDYKSLGQITLIVKKFIKENPKYLNFDAAFVVVMAVNNAWCNDPRIWEESSEN